MTDALELTIADLRDPGAAIAEVSRRKSLRPGDVRVALYRDPSTAQELLDVVELPDDEWSGLPDWELSAYLERKIEPFSAPAWDGSAPRHATLTVVARFGFTVFGPGEGRWMIAWSYCHHFKHMFTSGFVVLTEHGWTDFMTLRGGADPALPPPDAG